ncbi:hypothetical protein [Desulfonatronum parangueonense]
MTKGKNISRFFSDRHLEMVASDFQSLFTKICNSCGDLDFQIRNNYFNIYYRGNSLAKVTPNIIKNSYKVEVDKKFHLKSIIERLNDRRFPVENIFSENGKSDIAVVESSYIYAFFQSKVIQKIMKKIKDANYSEEMYFEQTLITDNSKNKDFIIIDRQVSFPGNNRSKIDLLALRNHNNIYKFVILEVKLGNNPELSGNVANQIESYISLAKNNIDSMKECYKKNYQQKRVLGVIGDETWPKAVEIGNEVEGVIVVGHYSGLAENNIQTLLSKHPNLESDIILFRNVISESSPSIFYYRSPK